MLTHFAGYESVHFGLHYAAKNEPTWGLMHFPVMYGRELRKARRVSYWPLSFINGGRVGGKKEMDKALEEAGSAAGIR